MDQQRVPAALIDACECMGLDGKAMAAKLRACQSVGEAFRQHDLATWLSTNGGGLLWEHVMDILNADDWVDQSVADAAPVLCIFQLANFKRSTEHEKLARRMVEMGSQVMTRHDSRKVVLKLLDDEESALDEKLNKAFGEMTSSPDAFRGVATEIERNINDYPEAAKHELRRLAVALRHTAQALAAVAPPLQPEAKRARLADEEGVKP